MIDKSYIKNKNFNLCVVGMGRIGLPLAISFAYNGVKVYGVEKDSERLTSLSNNKLPFFEPGMQEALDNSSKSELINFVTDANFDFGKCQIIIVAIGTPLKENLLPDMSLILQVVSKISKQAKDDSIIILRSTLVPGTTLKQILPQIKKYNKSLHVAVCPERIVEGSAMKEIAQLPEIVGVEDSHVGEIVRELFLLLGRKEISVTNTTSAEAAKIFTNVYRYVNFALANEFALISENLRINAAEVIKLANAGYKRSNIPLPGPAAGPCLRKDGLFLSNVSAVNLTKVAWLLNESVPAHITNTIEKHFGNLHGKLVGVLGKTYKPNIDDIRDSPSIRLIEELEIRGATVLSFDPYLPNSNKIEDVLACEIVILAVNHSYFDEIPAEAFRGTKMVYDVWGQLSKLDLASLGIIYTSLGSGIWNPQELKVVKY